MSTNQLSLLARADASAISVPPPPRRLMTRVFVPAFVVLSALALMAYAAREALQPAVHVVTTPAVPLSRAPAAAGAPAGSGNTSAADDRSRIAAEIVQAPGWVEADPYAVSVPALAEGVVLDLPVLEGQPVDADQIVARLVDDDAKLAQARAAAELARATAAVAEARANVRAEEARAADARDALEWSTPLADAGALPQRELTERRLRLAAQDALVSAAQAAAARAEAEQRIAQTALAEAELALARMVIRAPAAGVVMTRLVEPGQRLMRDAMNPYAGVVVRLYDPRHLQARVDIPLADAAKVAPGDAVELSSEALPDHTLHGTLSRIVSEANLQKNTLQVKIAITDAPPELKPEMLVKARISARSRPAATTAPAGAAGEPTASDIMLAPRAALVHVTGNEAHAWIVDLATSTAQLRTLHLGGGDAQSVEVLRGLRPGDRLILNPPPTLTPNTRVRATETAEER